MATEAPPDTSGPRVGSAATAEAPRPLVILHVITGLQVGGAETALLRLIQTSDRLLLKHVVLSLTSGGALAGQFRATGAEVTELNLGASRPSILEIWRFLRAVRRCRPDVIQGWMVHGNLFAWAGRMFARPRARLAWNLRYAPFGAVHEKRTTIVLTKGARLLSRTVDVLVSNSQAALDEYRLWGYRARSELFIPNGFDPERFRPDPCARRETRSALGLGDSMVFGILGRVHPAKGHEIFIEAAKRVGANTRNARFVLIGRDTDDPNGKLAALIEEAGIGDVTVCLGERRDIERLLPALDVLCAPSIYEGFPNAVGEAMAAGLPCIASRVSDVPTILGDTGIIVEPGNAEELGDAMIRLAEMSPRMRSEMGLKARDRLVRTFTMTRNIATYTQMYLSIVGGRPSPS